MNQFYAVLAMLSATILLGGCAATPPRSGQAATYAPSPPAWMIASAWTSDPRMGIAWNSGRRVSWIEYWDAVPVLGWPASVWNAIYAACGLTETQYTFDRRLDSPGSRFNLALARELWRRGMLSPSAYREYLQTLLQHGHFTPHVLACMREMALAPPREIVDDEVLFRRWSEQHGVSTAMYAYLQTFVDTNTALLLAERVRDAVHGAPEYVHPETICCAVEAHLIPRDLAQALLAFKFYDIYETAVFAMHASPLLQEKFLLDGAIATYHVQRAVQQLSDARAHTNQMRHQSAPVPGCSQYHE